MISDIPFTYTLQPVGLALVGTNARARARLQILFILDPISASKPFSSFTHTTHFEKEEEEGPRLPCKEGLVS